MHVSHIIGARKQEKEVSAQLQFLTAQAEEW
jgi:hypothetical protein